MAGPCAHGAALAAALHGLTHTCIKTAATAYLLPTGCIQAQRPTTSHGCFPFRAQALSAGQAPSAVYGAEHLLRLFVKLPELLPHTGELAICAAIVPLLRGMTKHVGVLVRKLLFVCRHHRHSAADVPEDQLQLLLRRVEDVLTFLQINAAKLFLPVPEYVSAAAVNAAADAAAAAAAAAGGFVPPPPAAAPLPKPS